mgnify:CR=1 FL=1
MKQLLLGIGAAAAAIALSSYTTNQSNPGDMFGNTNAGQYTQISSYNPANCENAEANPCAYRELPAGSGHVSAPFTAEQAAEWESLGYLEKASENNGLYVE